MPPANLTEEAKEILLDHAPQWIAVKTLEDKMKFLAEMAESCSGKYLKAEPHDPPAVRLPIYKKESAS